MRFSSPFTLVFTITTVLSASLPDGLLGNGKLGLFDPSSFIPQLYPLIFPLANAAGSILSPAVKALIGKELLEKLDTLADTLCIAAGKDPSGGGGICQAILQKLAEIVAKDTPIGQIEVLKELLRIACVAKNTQPPTGTCQSLLELTDCTANRILGVEDLECDGKLETD